MSKDKKITEDFVRIQSKVYFGIPYEISTETFLHSFSTHFGTRPSIVKLIYNEFVNNGTMPYGYRIKYLLWALYFLRSNETDLKLSANFGFAVMTVRKWIWVSVGLISNLKIVSFFYFYFFLKIIFTNYLFSR